MQKQVTTYSFLLFTFIFIQFAKCDWMEVLQDYLVQDTTKTSSLFENNLPYGKYYLINNNKNLILLIFLFAETFDFIVVGAGSAGSVIANRLTENTDVTVLLIEAGEEERYLSEIPFEANALLDTKYNWNYVLEPQENMCYGMVDKKCTWPRGKALGGSSAINDMIYTRGNKKDYDIWAEMGNEGWSYADVLPYFLKSEQSHLKNADTDYHNTQGLQSVEFPAFDDPVTTAFLQAGKETGQEILDYNGRSQLGFSKVQGTTKDGKRASTATAFLYPFINRTNLHILKSSMVTKVLIDSDKNAYGVQYVHHGKEYAVNASKEVILSAGVIGSPQILMLSGVGPKNDLERVKIPVIHDLPVGKTLYDHITFPGLIFTHNATAETAENFTSFLNWIYHGKGILTTLGGTQAIGYINTKNELYPDIELLFSLGSIANSGTALKISNYKPEIIEQYFKPLQNLTIFNIITELMHPKYVGYLTLRSNDPYDYPIINPNYYSDPEDLKVHIAGIRFVLQLAKTQSFKKVNAQLYDRPVPGCEENEENSDEYWTCALKQIAMTAYHPSGSCKMGPITDPKAVVDNKLKVYGIKSLRVADSSIFPKIITGHTNAPSIMIGEKAVDLIKDDWF